ncbi:MAG: DUF1735 domain-containing protein [Thermonemataceae bacterium]|nr:DUF1735 domain-containing protein [Thermonemataceae bacterium]
MKKITKLALSTALLGVMLTSCLKDKEVLPGSNNIVNGVDASNVVVSFTGAAGVDEITYGVAPQVDAQKVFIGISSNVPVPQDVTLQVKLLATPDGETPLPTDYYTFPETVTIKAGERESGFSIEMVNTDQLDFSAKYYLGFEITSTSSGIVASNLRFLNAKVVVKNEWAGSYAWSAYLDHPNNTLDGTYAGTKTLSTVDATTTIMNAGPFGGTTLVAWQTNLDNTLTYVTAPGAGIPVCDPISGLPNYYDPVAKKFVMNYSYTLSNGTRFLNETCTLK